MEKSVAEELREAWSEVAEGEELDSTLRGELGALVEVLARVADGDLSSQAEGRGPLSATAAVAPQKIGDTLAKARRHLGRAVHQGAQSGHLVDALDAAWRVQDDAVEEALTKVRHVEPRVEEAGEISDHLDEVVTQAGVAALNVSVEITRSSAGTGSSTLALLADEVRRLSDRSASLARRLSSAADSLRASLTEVAEALEASRRERPARDELVEQARRVVEALTESHNEARRDLRGVRLPEDTRAAELASMLDRVEERLSEELQHGGGELPAEVGDAVERLEGRLRDARRRQATPR